MESRVVRGESAKLSRERRGSLDKKVKSAKSPQSVPELLRELASLKVQTADFFVRERGLCGRGLNPKHSGDMSCVTPEKIEEVWGKCSTFKTSNTTLNPQSRAELLRLCAKIYGKVEITNNEFMAWVVKGYIAELMGLEVNWASAAASTTLLLVSRLEGELLKRDLTTEEAIAFKHLAPHAVAKPSSSHSKANAGFNDLGSQAMGAKLCSGKFKYNTGVGLPPVLAAEIVQAEEVLLLEDELLTITENKQRFLNAKKTSIAERIIGFKFGMDDRNADAEDATKNLKVVEEGLKQNGLLILALETTVQQFRDNLDEGNDQFRLGLQKLEKLRLERDVQSTKLEFAKFSFEECERRAKKAREDYSNAGLDMRKCETDIAVIARELEEVRRYKDAVADQIQMMQHGGGVACCPKPCLHPQLPNNTGTVFNLEACSFCNRWYTSFDVVMTSCKHFYHPFCIAKLAEIGNACVTCKQKFDPAWWRSFGFRSREIDVEDAAAEASLARSMEELSETLKDSYGLPIREWSQSKGKQSDRGSSGSIHLAQNGPPCISGSRLKDAIPSHTEDLQPKLHASPTGHRFDEVDSPVKDVGGDTSNNTNLIVGRNTSSEDIDREVVAPRFVSTDMAMEDMEIAANPAEASPAEVSPAEASPAEASPAEASPVEASPGTEVLEDASERRYSFSVKRSCDPCTDDSSMRKKVSKLCVAKQGSDVYKATRLSTRSPLKNGSSRRHECRKGDVEPEIIGLEVDIVPKVVTRSRVKNN